MGPDYVFRISICQFSKLIFLFNSSLPHRPEWICRTFHQWKLSWELQGLYQLHLEHYSSWRPESSAHFSSPQCKHNLQVSGSPLLYISTSLWVLLTPNAGQNITGGNTILSEESLKGTDWFALKVNKWMKWSEIRNFFLQHNPSTRKNGIRQKIYNLIRLCIVRT